MISYGLQPVLGPCMTITMPIGGACDHHGHPAGKGTCPCCLAEIERFNADAQRALLQPLPPPPAPPLVWKPLYVGEPDESLRITCGGGR